MIKPIAVLTAVLLLAGCTASAHPWAPQHQSILGQAGAQAHAPAMPRPAAVVAARAKAAVSAADGAAISRAVTTELAPGKVAHVVVESSEAKQSEKDVLWITGIADLTEAGKKTDEVCYAGYFDRRTGKIAEFEALYWYEQDGPGSSRGLLEDALKKHLRGGRVTELSYEATDFTAYYTFRAVVAKKKAGKTTVVEVTGEFDRYKTTNTYYGEHPEGPFKNLKEREVGAQG